MRSLCLPIASQASMTASFTIVLSSSANSGLCLTILLLCRDGLSCLATSAIRNCRYCGAMIWRCLSRVNLFVACSGMLTKSSYCQSTTKSNIKHAMDFKRTLYSLPAMGSTYHCLAAIPKGIIRRSFMRPDQKEASIIFSTESFQS